MVTTSTGRRGLLGLLVLGFVLVACGTPAASPSTSAPQSGEPAASEEPAESTGEASEGPEPSEGGSAATGCEVGEALTPISFQLNFTAGGYNAGFALALQEGYYEEVGLNVTILKGQGSGTTARLVASGQAGLAYADAIAVMQLVAQGAPIKILSTMYQSVPNAVTALADSGITEFEDLRGKSVAEPVGETPTAVFPILLEANGFAPDDVERVPMPGTSMVSALLQGQVDAILGSTDGYDLILEGEGAEIVSLPFADYGVGTVSTSIIASESFLESNGNEVRCFIEASLRGWDAAIDDPSAAIDALVETFPQDTRPELNLGQLEAAIDLFCKNDAQFVGKAEPEAWANTVEIAQDVLELPDTLEAEEYYTYDYLPAELPTACPIEE